MGKLFRYISDDVLAAQDRAVEKCQLCGESKNLYEYVGEIKSDGQVHEVYALCADCIKNTEFHKFDELRTRQEIFDIVKAEYPKAGLNEVKLNVDAIVYESQHTPCVVTFIQSKDWPYCCGDLTEYIGDHPVNGTSFKDYTRWAAQNNLMKGFKLSDFYPLDKLPVLYTMALFHCHHCEKKYWVFQYSGLFWSGPLSNNQGEFKVQNQPITCHNCQTKQFKKTVKEKEDTLETITMLVCQKCSFIMSFGTHVEKDIEHRFPLIHNDALELLHENGDCPSCDRTHEALYMIWGDYLKPDGSLEEMMSDCACEHCIKEGKILTHQTRDLEEHIQNYANDPEAFKYKLTRIPSLVTFSQHDDWVFCCGEGCEYIGYPDTYEEAAELSRRAQFWDYKPIHWSDLGYGDLAPAYLGEIKQFRCTTCGKEYFTWQYT